MNVTIQFANEEDRDLSNMNHSVIYNNWTTQELTLYLNISQPLLISQSEDSVDIVVLSI